MKVYVLTFTKRYETVPVGVFETPDKARQFQKESNFSVSELGDYFEIFAFELQ
jgi:hypothetical protein